MESNFQMEGISTSPRRSAKRTSEPVDDWLHNEGLFRKHCPKDPTCLFRAVSEQVYLAQHYHIQVRNECVAFMRENRQLFEEKIPIPYESYLEQMACFTEWGGIHEIQAMSLMYQRDFIIFDGHTLTKNAINNNFGMNKCIFLCFTSQRQYESVYTQEYIGTAGFCQSMVYQVVYKNVFEMENVDETVHKMLHDKSHSYRHDKFFLKENMENRENMAAELLCKMEEGSSESEELKMINKGHTPFPYRVAKALDPDIYRNTDFDIWHEIRREVRNSGWTKFNGMEFQVGGQCLVDLNVKHEDVTNNNDLSHLNLNKNEFNDSEKRKSILLSGHIQEMTKNEGPVVVFILELGEKRTVPFSSLRPMPSKKSKSNGSITGPKKNANLEPNPKIKKSSAPAARKSKDQTIGSPSPQPSERNTNKPTPCKKNENGFKWANETSKSSKATFGKQYTDKFPPTEDFTADVDFFEEEGKNDVTSYNEPNDENLKTCPQKLPVVPANGSENNFQLPPHHNPTYFVPPEENCNYPMIPYFEMLPNVAYLLEQIGTPINLALSKSNDVNAGDLPLHDPQSLRFFYNLGLQYFHAVSWIYGLSPPPVINSNYFAMDNSAGHKPVNIPVPQVRQDEMNQNANNMNQKSAPVIRSKKENSENGGGKGSSAQRPPKNSNVRFNAIQESQMNNARKNKDCNKNSQFFANKENNARLPPRFKKNVDGRNRNFNPSKRHQQRDAAVYERNCGMQGNHQNQIPQQVPMHVNNPPYQYPPNQPPIYQQPIFNEAELYCQGNPGLIPVPYMHPTDSGENNANLYPPMVYTGMDNYPQAYIPYYPPFAYPPQAVYPAPAANPQENWYQFPGHSHYIPPFVSTTPLP